MRLLYNLGIYLYYALIFIFSFFNAKAKAWWDGRKDLFSHLEALKLENTRIAWFHAASLGEFEQGRPVLEKFRNNGKGVLLETFGEAFSAEGLF